MGCNLLCATRLFRGRFKKGISSLNDFQAPENHKAGLVVFWELMGRFSKNRRGNGLTFKDWTGNEGVLARTRLRETKGGVALLVTARRD